MPGINFKIIPSISKMRPPTKIRAMWGPDYCKAPPKKNRSLISVLAAPIQTNPDPRFKANSVEGSGSAQ